MLAGEADFLLKVVARGWGDYQKFLTTRLTAVPNVGRVSTALAIHSAKQELAVPISTTVVEVD